jgi:hypothetical protein
MVVRDIRELRDHLVGVSLLPYGTQKSSAKDLITEQAGQFG